MTSIIARKRTDPNQIAIEYPVAEPVTELVSRLDQPGGITTRQRDFIRDLYIETLELRGVEMDIEYIESYMQLAVCMNRKAASERIGDMKEEVRQLRIAKKNAPKPEAKVAAEGFYKHGDTVAKVAISKTSGKPYAKALSSSSWKFEYAPGLVYRLDPADKLTVEEAAKLGHHHGVCMICARTLTDPESVARGIGPVCIKRVR